MFQQLVSRNDDIRRLVEKGYAVAFDAGHYLVVRDIPYLDRDRNLQWGAIVTKFIDQGGDLIAQENHQVFFAGGTPHGLDGQPVGNLGEAKATLALSDDSKDVVIQCAFSNKPTKTGAYDDFFHKVENYVNKICGPAIELYNASPLTFRVVTTTSVESPFKLRDTLTSRAEIGDLAAKFSNDVIAIIGLGGTGAFVLDFIVKTPVREIRAFDRDVLHVHNLFRSPGKMDEGEFGRSKADVYHARYENFRHGLTITNKFIDTTCADDLKGATFAFVCVDKGSSRAGIFDLLIGLGIPFIDVGMGLRRRDGMLNGMMRTTYYDVDTAAEMRDHGLAELADSEDDIYRTNIQIGELNSLNASLAVIRFKQIRGYFFTAEPRRHFLFQLGSLKIRCEEKPNED